LPAVTEPRATLPDTKLCELEDFVNPALQPYVDSVYSGCRTPERPRFPEGMEERKHWEIAMALRTLSDFNALRDDAEILGVGAGNETTIFWLTTRVKRVFATDLYAAPGEWERNAPPKMLWDPAPSIPISWDPRRLVVQNMNALDLHYVDGSFDGVFSSSSIEHFGTFDDVRWSIEEAVRVLKPGGVLTVSTEYRLAGEPPGMPNVLLFDQEQLRQLFAGLPLRPLSEFNPVQSAATCRVIVDFNESAEDVRNQRPSFRTYPHIVLQYGEHLWTSVHLGFVKTA
jgi:SAM-dependent methyltransferase